VNFVIAATTMALVIPAELPDKTFISSVLLASRNRPLPVWLGTALALTLQAAIAVVAGRFIELLPHTAVRAIVAALFIGGAAFLIFVPERAEEEEGERLAGKEPEAKRSWRVFLTTFTIITLAEFGDITQVLILNLTARYKAPWSVFAGATVGFWLVAGAGVLAGRTITRRVPLSVVRRLSGLALLGFGIWSIVGLI
jgi:putative Ca2+/H+ antiporter (TMEM165/GDT1 family)